MKIPHISISRESLYKTCPQHYRYHYHDELPVLEPVPIYLTLGKVAHKIIETFTLARGERNINDICKEVLAGKILIDGKPTPELNYEMRKRLNNHLISFMKLSNKIGTDGEVEWEFNVDLDPPHNRKVKGFIDRIIKNDKGLFLLDYKTSKVSPWRKDHRTITKDLQLQCYCWVTWKRFDVDPRQIKAALYYLEDGKLVPACYSEKTLSTVPERLLQVYKEIETANPDKVVGNVGEHCRRCDYRRMCPFYSLI